jgi:hypothetical protein
LQLKGKVSNLAKSSKKKEKRFRVSIRKFHFWPGSTTCTTQVNLRLLSLFQYGKFEFLIAHVKVGLVGHFLPSMDRETRDVGLMLALLTALPHNGMQLRKKENPKVSLSRFVLKSLASSLISLSRVKAAALQLGGRSHTSLRDPIYNRCN